MPTFEPFEYFEYLKGKIESTTLDSLVSQNSVIELELQRAFKVGMSNVVHKLTILREIIIKEKLLLVEGFDTYINRSDVIKFIDNVEPVNSVKIVELAKYPRIIP